MYLIDTNIPLELLSNQKNASEVRQFFDRIPLNQIYISDFSLYSIGIFLFKGNKPEVFNQFIQDMFNNGGINLARIHPGELTSLTSITREYDLDFDDAYQYAVAQKLNLTLISFDSDFDRTPEQAKIPSECTL